MPVRIFKGVNAMSLTALLATIEEEAKQLKKEAEQILYIWRY